RHPNQKQPQTEDHEHYPQKPQASHPRNLQVGPADGGHLAHHAPFGRGRPVMKFRRHREDSLDDEIRDYIERETRANIEGGMAPDDARDAAMRKLGPPLHVKEDTRAAWGLVWIERLWQDLVHGRRMLAKNP